MLENLHILPQSYDYGYAVDLGALFALIVMALSKMLSKFIRGCKLRDKTKIQRFSTASR